VAARTAGYDDHDTGQHRETDMRRTASALVIIVLVLAVSTPAASAGPALSGTQTGTFSGTSTYELFVPACPVIHQIFRGTYDPDRGGVPNGSYVADVCVDQPNADFAYPFSGTFVITTGQGFSLTGTVTGLQDTDDTILGLEATMVVTDSPGSRHPLRGTITVTGTSDQSFPAPPGTSVEAGTFAADIHREG
jgi:hypothetical protein